MGINANYKEVLYKFTKSGSHEAQFFGFCGGRLDVYYLRKLLELKPGLNETVRGGLPAECEIESDKPISSVSCSSAEPSSGRKNKRHFQETVLADSINALGKKLEEMEEPPEVKQKNSIHGS